MPVKIHSIPMGLVQAYLIENEGGLVLVDAGMPRFHRMPYYQLPDEVLESPEMLGAWMDKSLDVAHTTAAKKKK